MAPGVPFHPRKRTPCRNQTAWYFHLGLVASRRRQKMTVLLKPAPPWCWLGEASAESGTLCLPACTQGTRLLEKCHRLGVCVVPKQVSYIFALVYLGTGTALELGWNFFRYCPPWRRRSGQVEVVAVDFGCPHSLPKQPLRSFHIGQDLFLPFTL